MPSRKLFVSGCLVLVALGLVHLLGHYVMTTSQGETEAERQLLALMRANPQDLGFGMRRSMFDILTGFSLTFSILPLAMGGAGLLVSRQASGAPALQRQMAIVYAGTYGIMTGVALRYWFPAPLLFLVLACVCFTAAVVTSRNE